MNTKHQKKANISHRIVVATLQNMFQMKILSPIRKSLSGFYIFLIILSQSGLAMPHEEFEHIISKNIKRAKLIDEKAEAIRFKQPEFSDWVRYQRKIHENIEHSARFDFDYRPSRLEKTLHDWDYFLNRMENECEIFSIQYTFTKDFINIKDLGAKGDGHSDDAPVIRKALEQAAQGSVKTIFLPKGTYFVGFPLDGDGLKPSQDPRQRIFQLNNYKNIKILGEEGSILKTKSARSTLFSIVNSENIQIENITRISEIHPYSWGTIVATNSPSTLVLKPDEEGLLSLDDNIFKKSDSQGLLRCFRPAEITAKPTFRHSGPHIYKPEITKRNDGLFEVNTKGISFPWAQFSDYHIGDRYILFARDWFGPAIELINSEHCRLTNVKIHSSSGINLMLRQSSANFITHCSFTPPPGISYPITSTADGYYEESGILGNYIAENVFSHHFDDFFNVHARPSGIIRQEGNIIYLPMLFSQKQIDNIQCIELIPHAKTDKQYATERFQVQKAEIVEERIRKIVDRVNSRQGNIIETDGKNSPILLLKLTLDRIPEKLKTLYPFAEKSDITLLHARYKEKYDMIYFPQFFSFGQVIAKNQLIDSGVSRILHLGSTSLFTENNVQIRRRAVDFMQPTANRFREWWDEAYYQRYTTIDKNNFTLPDCRILNMDSVDYDPLNPETWAAHLFFTNNNITFTPAEEWQHLEAILLQGGDDIVIYGNTITTNIKRGPLITAKNATLILQENAIHKYFDPKHQLLENTTLLPYPVK